MESIVHLNNITCNGCVRSVKEKLTDISSIHEITIDIPTGKVVFEHEESMDLDQVLEILDEAGYPEK